MWARRSRASTEWFEPSECEGLGAPAADRRHLPARPLHTVTRAAGHLLGRHESVAVEVLDDALARLPRHLLVHVHKVLVDPAVRRVRRVEACSTVRAAAPRVVAARGPPRPTPAALPTDAAPRPHVPRAHLRICRLPLCPVTYCYTGAHLRICSASIRMSSAWPRAPPIGWWIMTRECGSAMRFPFSPAPRMNEPCRPWRTPV